jgi:hypothetical protein
VAHGVSWMVRLSEAVIIVAWFGNGVLRPWLQKMASPCPHICQDFYGALGTLVLQYG